MRFRASNLGAKSTGTMPSSLSIPVAIPPPPAQLALVALQVASILTSDAVTSATARIASSLVGPNCVGHVRPTTAFFQSIGDKQTYIGVPGADDLLVADAKFIADHVARATSLDSPFHDEISATLGPTSWMQSNLSAPSRTIRMLSTPTASEGWPCGSLWRRLYLPPTKLCNLLCHRRRCTY